MSQLPLYFFFFFWLYRRIKGQLISKRTNTTIMIPKVDLFSFVFWKNLKTSKRHFEIKCPLEIIVKSLLKFLVLKVCYFSPLWPCSSNWFYAFSLRRAIRGRDKSFQKLIGSRNVMELSHYRAQCPIQSKTVGIKYLPTSLILSATLASMKPKSL